MSLGTDASALYPHEIFEAVSHSHWQNPEQGCSNGEQRELWCCERKFRPVGVSYTAEGSRSYPAGAVSIRLEKCEPFSGLSYYLALIAVKGCCACPRIRNFSHGAKISGVDCVLCYLPWCPIHCSALTTGWSLSCPEGLMDGFSSFSSSAYDWRVMRARKSCRDFSNHVLHRRVQEGKVYGCSGRSLILHSIFL